MELIHSETYRNTLLRIIDVAEEKLSEINGKTIVITGATGMLGSCLVDTLASWNQRQTVPVKIVAVSRSAASAKERFYSCWDAPFFSFVEQDVCEELRGFPDHVDYIIHAAGNGDPISFSRFPTETLLANVVGSDALLRYGKDHGMKRFLYLSSGEIYGNPISFSDVFTEEYCGPIDFFNSRSCYPEGKRAAEILCQSYIHQYGVDCVIARPCHLFGPTMTRRDSRAVSQFFMNSVEGKPVVLKSSGEVERSHCYVADAVSAILYLLTDGVCGKAYNIADPDYQMTIRTFAEKVAQFGNGKLVFENPDDIESKGYSQRKRSILDAFLLEKLGWKPMPKKTSAILETIKILQEANFAENKEGNSVN